MALGVILWTAGCGGSSPPKYVYPKSAEEGFMVGCTSAGKGHLSTCTCALHWLENNVSFLYFEKYDVVASAAPPVRWRESVRKACGH
jgi:hypothetical protein